MSILTLRAALCFAKNDTNLGRLTRSCLDTFPASREMAISKTFFARPTAIVHTVRAVEIAASQDSHFTVTTGAVRTRKEALANH